MTRISKQIINEPSDDQPGETIETPPVAVRAKRVYKKRVKKVIEEVTPDTEPKVDEVKTSIKALSLESLERKKRVPSKYNLFVREQMTKQSIKDLPPKQRFSAVSKAWKESKI